jgi:hypothetical protein
MLSYTFVDAFTLVERHEAIARLKNAIAAADGVIVDFAFFSEQAIRLSVELEADAVAVLREELEASDVHLFEKCAADLDRAAPTERTRKTVLALLHVTFAEDEARRAASLAM